MSLSIAPSLNIAPEKKIDQMDVSAISKGNDINFSKTSCTCWLSYPKNFYSLNMKFQLSDSSTELEKTDLFGSFLALSLSLSLSLTHTHLE